MINIDSTLIYQIIAFFVLLVILNRLLYRPVQALLKEREERIEGTLEKAAASDRDLEQSIAEYEKRLKEAAVKGHEERNRIKAEGLAREKELIEAARAAASKELGAMRTEIERGKTSALASLKAEAGALGKDIASRLLDRKVVIALFALVLPFLPTLARAAEEAHHEGGGGGVWKIINFVILVIGVLLAWFKGIKPMLEKRGEEIKKALEDARRAKEEADRKALEFKEKLSLLERKIQDIQQELKMEGEAEKERIISEAEAASAKIAEQAKLAASQEVKKAKEELRQVAAGLAVEMAREVLAGELTPDDQKRLVKDYIDNLRLN
ncbi:MAG: hypothetical protein ACE5EI_10280 [Thermodesulfobacteriota bacterium]